MRYFIGVAFWAVLFASGASAIEIRHSNTTWAGQGMCVYEFTVDAQGSQGGIENFSVDISLLDGSGKPLGDEKTADLDGILGDSNATRYGQLFVEGDCEAKSLRINKATGSISGKPVDFVKEKQLAPRKFKPLPIAIE